VLVALGSLALLGVVGAAWGTRAVWQGWPRDSVETLPEVSSAPPLSSIASAWIEDPPRSRERFFVARQQARSIDPSAVPRLVEWLAPVGPASFRRQGERPASDFPDSTTGSALRVEYSLDEALTEQVFEIFRRGRVERGQAIVLDPRSGRLLAYVSTNPEALPPERTYPAASIVKLVTAATLLEEAPDEAARPCVYRGNKYRLSRRRLARPKRGHETTLARALASSNNQCFSQWAVHVLGEEKMRGAFERFGWLAPPAPGHEAGRIEEIENDLDLGKLGSGLDGIRVNPLHVASLATILTGGHWIESWWIDRVVDSSGRSVRIPPRAPSRQVISQDLADRLRSMMVGTTTRGTAKSAFHTRRGRRLLGEIDVAGKTGNLTGSDPYGRYEWFLGLAPAQDPTIAVVILQLQSNLWWSRSSELAAKVLRSVFCDKEGCRRSLSDRYTGDLSGWTDPLLISELERPLFISRAN
jgi:peptidoglycan glycosyltransferase